jgi:hypothetical protein
MAKDAAQSLTKALLTKVSPQDSLAREAVDTLTKQLEGLDSASLAGVKPDTSSIDLQPVKDSASLAVAALKPDTDSPQEGLARAAVDTLTEQLDKMNLQPEVEEPISV